MVKSVYIHIPFCKSKCHYCSFISFNRLELLGDYLYILKQEINKNYKGEKLNTLYFGGGTPSILSPADFGDLLNLFNVDEDTEITTELNPETLNYDYFRALYDIGINRVSLGCQTFNDDILKLINRRHNSKQVIDAVQNAKKAGFKNLSLDFIYGLPNQTIEMFIQDLERGVDLGIEHVSLYGLTIEDGCYFSKFPPKSLPTDDEQADMYIAAVECLSKRGFEHYEISNFSKPGFNSRHNLNYWNNEEYYGFGVGAHGYINGVRYGNAETIEEYLKNPLVHNQERVETYNDKLEEEIFLGFRKMKGIDVLSINNKYNIDFEDKYSEILKKYLSLKMIQKTSKGYSLTLDGVLVSNTILAEFIL